MNGQVDLGERCLADATALRPPPTAPAPRAEKQRIVIVDDEPSIRNFMYQTIATVQEG
jgi:hypothetical protein